MSEADSIPRLDDIRMGRVSYRVRPEGFTWRKSYHRLLWELSIVWEGAWNIELTDKTIHLEMGHGILIPPSEIHTCRVSSKEDCLNLHIHFELDWPSLHQVALKKLTLTPRVLAYLRDMLDILGTTAVSDYRRRAILGLALMEMVQPTTGQTMLPYRMLSETDNDLVQTVLQSLQGNLREGMQMGRLCELTGYSASRLRTLFRRSMGISLTEAMFTIRLEESQRMLLYSNLKISSIASKVGFKQASKFTRFFRQRVGITPSQYAKSGTSPGVAWKGQYDELNTDEVVVEA